MKTRFPLLLALIVALAAPALAQGTGGDAELTTGVNGASNDTANKPIAGGDLLSFNIASPGGSLIGQTAALAGDLIPDGFPICINLGAGGVCDLNLGSNLFLIYFPQGNILDPTVIAGGLEAAFVVPNDVGLFLTPDDETLRLQAAITDPTAFLGAEITNFIDHFTNKFTLPGPTSDDGNVLIDLGAGFPFYGVVHTEVYVNSNGNLTFGSPDSDFGSSEAEMLSDQARIAPLWTDVSPNVSGSIDICYDRAPGGALVSLAVDWIGVPGFSTPGSDNTWSAVLDMAGHIDFAWTSVENQAGNAGTTGITPGGGISLANDVGLMSALGGPVVGASMEAIYHVYDDSCGNDEKELAGGSATYAYDGVDAYTLTTGGTFDLATTVDSLSPSSGADTGGDTAAFTGCGFDGGNTYTVDFGGNVVAGNVIDIQNLDCVTPAGTGTVDVTVLENGSPIATFLGGWTYVPAGVFVTPGPTSDDGVVNVVFNNGPVNFYGVAYTDIFVNANGNCTFTAGDTDFGESVTEFLTQEPRIACFWDDCNPSNAPGLITATETLTSFSIDYANVTAYNAGDNSCVITIDTTTNDISLAYGAVCSSFDGGLSTNAAIAGISPGTAGVDLGVDLSAPAGSVGGATDALFEYFNSGPAWDVSGTTVSFTWNGAGYTH